MIKIVPRQKRLYRFIDFYNNHCYDESLNNLWPAEGISEESKRIIVGRKNKY